MLNDQFGERFRGTTSMKLTILFAALFLAVCQISADTPGFAIDREYKYQYRARSATGITKHIDQFSGIGFRGNVILQNQGNYIYLKFEDLEYGQFNQRFENVDIHDELPVKYQPVGGSHTFLKEALTKPIRVTIQKGLVKSFDVYPEDPEWSVNIKRSILSLFQLNMDGVNRIRMSPSNYMKPEENADFYRVMEDGIGGECETIYEIAHHAFHHHVEEAVVNVTKHRRYDHCNHRPYSVFTTHMGYKNEGVTLDPLTSVSVTDYQLKGDRHFYTIERIYNHGKFHFTPFTVNAETVISGFNQTLFLTNSWPIKTPITFPEKHLTYTSLAYNGTDESHFRPTEIDLNKPNPVGFRFHEPKPFDFKTPIGKLIPELGATYTLEDDMIEKKLPEKFVNLVKILRLLTFEELKEVYTTFLNYDYLTATPEKQREKKSFMDALVTVGTNPAVKFIFYALEQKYIRPNPASTFLDSLAYHVTDPSETLVEYFYTHMKKVDKTEKKLYKVLWMAFGTLVHRGCDKVTGFHDDAFHHTHHHVSLIKSETCLRYAKDVHDKLVQTTVNWEEILYIKVLANMGLKDTWKYLVPILTGDEHYSEVVRLQSFWAALKYTETIKEEVLSVIVPIFNNYTEPHAIRIAAFEVIMHTQPHFPGLKALADRLHSEPDRQVASFIYSTYVALANSSNPNHLRLKRDCRRILSTVEPIFWGYQYSRLGLFNYYNDKYHFGGQTVVGWSGSNETIIPDTLYIEQSAQIMGYNFDYFSLDLETRGLGRIYEKLLGGDSILDPMDENKSILNMFRRHPRDVNTVQKELDEINNAVKVEPREHEPIEALMSLSAFDQEYSFMYFHQKEMQSLKESGYMYLPKELPTMLKNGYKMNHQKLHMIADVTYEIPTEMGIPLRFQVKVPAFTRLAGEVKFEVEPGFFPEDRNYKKATSFKLVTNLKPIMHVQAFTSVTLRSPIMSDYGYGCNHEFLVKFPLKINMDYDVKEKKFHFNYVPSQTEYKMIHYSNQPYTFINPKLNKTPLSSEKSILPIHYTQHPKEYEFKFGQKHFGAGIKVVRRSERTWTNWGSYYKTFTSFFTKRGRNFESNPYPYNIVHRIVDGLMSFRDFVRLYPSMKPYLFKLYYTPSTENPTTSYDLTIDFVKFMKTSSGIYVEDTSKTETIIPLNPTFRKVYGMHIDLVANGPVPRKYHLDYNVSYASLGGGMPKKLAIDYRRSPIPNYDPQEFKLCYRASLKTPQYNRFAFIEKTVEAKAELDYTIHFGKDCETDKQIDVKVLIEKTDEQKDHDTNPTHCPKYLACEKLMKQGSYLNVPCFEYYTTYYSLRKYTMDIQYKNLPTYFTTHVQRLTYWIKSYFYTNLDDYEPTTSNPEGQIRVVANYSLEEPATMDLVVKRPGANVYYKDIFYPYYEPLHHHFNVRRSPKYHMMDKLTHYSWHPTCVLVKDHLWTYDHFSYHVPETNCYTIYSKDCSKESLFTLLYKKTEGETKAIKLFAMKHEIEILPIGGALTLRVDDTKRTLSPDNLFVLRSPEYPTTPIMKIYYLNNGYVIKMPLIGLTVEFDGKMINLMVSNSYRGHLCGLCGDANGEPENELVGPNKCVYDEEHPFTYSYTVPDGTCTIPTYNAKDCYYPFADKNMGKCQSLNRNKVIHDVAIDGTTKQSSNVCFSTKPIRQCTAGCKAGNIIKSRVGFHCLNSRDDYTSLLIRESKIRELTELKNKSQDHYEVVEYPETCIHS